MAIDWLEYYSGGVPALDFFLLQVRDIVQLSEMGKDEPGLDMVAELCMIGLAAYFEAFCKNEFAAVVNICPETLRVFGSKRDCSLPIQNLLTVLHKAKTRLGFAVAEQYDFGSAKAVNGLFADLLKVTPFSKDEAKQYGEFLHDRNLLVHHGGIYTFRYAAQKFSPGNIRELVNFDSLVVTRKDVGRWAGFTSSMARKLGKGTRNGLLRFMKAHAIRCDPEKKKAIAALAEVGLSAAAAEVLVPANKPANTA